MSDNDELQQIAICAVNTPKVGYAAAIYPPILNPF